MVEGLKSMSPSAQRLPVREWQVSYTPCAVEADRCFTRSIGHQPPPVSKDSSETSTDSPAGKGRPS